MMNTYLVIKLENIISTHLYMTDESTFFCKTFLSKPHYHVENVITGKQYSFVGNRNKNILRKIQKNVDSDKPLYDTISPNDINLVLENTLPTDQQKERPAQRRYILKNSSRKIIN